MSTQTAQRLNDTRAWMANRYRVLDGRGRDAEAAGHAAFGKAARTGARFSAPRPSDVVTVGARRLAAPRPTPSDDFNEFRRQQAEFTKLQHEEQRKNAWLAIPALAPVVAVAGAEAAGWLGEQAVGRVVTSRIANVQPELAQIAKNRLAGNQLRDEIAEALRAAGREVRPEAFKRTPFGGRFIDLDVWLEGENLGGLEVKRGLSRYGVDQRLKDWWLKEVENYRVNLSRDK